MGKHNGNNGLITFLLILGVMLLLTLINNIIVYLATNRIALIIALFALLCSVSIFLIRLVKSNKNVKQESKKILDDAIANANQILDNATANANQILVDAKQILNKAEQESRLILSNTKNKNNQIIKEANINASKIVKKADAILLEATINAKQILNKAEQESRLILSKANIAAQNITTEADRNSQSLVSRVNIQKKFIEDEIKELKTLKSNIESEINILNNETISTILTIPKYELKSDEIKNKLSIINITQKNMINNNVAYTTNSVYSKVIESVLKKIFIRCYNAETVNIINNLNTKNIGNTTDKLQKVYESLNLLYKKLNITVSLDYHNTKLEELSLIYNYNLTLEQERQSLKEIKAQLKEEELLRVKIEKEKARINKEEKQFTNEIKKLMIFMQKANFDVEKQIYIEKIQELENQLRNLAVEKSKISEWERNTRAGFVYVISNIGSFGENIYKIGMTRRLEPMERVYELSSASVPFPFDVHALIFSEDAPALETLLHKEFQNQRVNNVNLRKEFFNVSIHRIKDIVHTNYNNTVKFIDIPEATEYWASVNYYNSDCK